MVQLVAYIGHGDGPHNLRIRRRTWIQVDHCNTIGPSPVRIEHGHIGQLLGRGFFRQARRWIETWIWLPTRHDTPLDRPWLTASVFSLLLTLIICTGLCRIRGGGR